jgi:hypothetical protein
MSNGSSEFLNDEKSINSDDLRSLIKKMADYLSVQNDSDIEPDFIAKVALKIRDEKNNEYVKNKLQGLSIKDLTTLVSITGYVERPIKRDKTKVKGA